MKPDPSIHKQEPLQPSFRIIFEIMHFSTSALLLVVTSLLTTLAAATPVAVTSQATKVQIQEQEASAARKVEGQEHKEMVQHCQHCAPVPVIVNAMGTK